MRNNVSLNYATKNIYYKKRTRRGGAFTRSKITWPDAGSRANIDG